MAAWQRTLTATQGIDEEGKVRLQPITWTKKVARTLAKGEVPGVLTQEHWEVIDWVRQYYLDFEMLPPVRMVVRRSGFSLRHIQGLFPNGFADGVCKVAGIPRNTIRVDPVLHVQRG